MTGRRLWILMLAVFAFGVVTTAPEAVAHDFGKTAEGGGAEDDEEDGDPRECDECCEDCPGSESGGSSQQSSQSSSSGSPPSDGTDVCQEPEPRTDQPVRFATRSLVETVTDLVVPGIYPIRLVRRYDSQSRYDSPLGYGWSFNFDLRLYDLADGSVVVRSRCGDRDRYVDVGGTWQLADPERGRAGKLVSTGGGTYELTLPYSNETARFDAEGRLEYLEDVHGNRLEMTWEPAPMPLTGLSSYALDPGTPLVVARTWQLKRISERAAEIDPGTGQGWLSGRWVEFDYDGASGRLKEAKTHDDRIVTYTPELLVAEDPSSATGNLEEVVGLEGVTETYAYTDPSDPHNLTSITRGAGMTPIVVTYDTEDRVVTETVGQTVWNFECNPAQPENIRCVTRTLVDVDGTRQLETVYELNDDGYITKITDPLDNEFHYQRDAQPGRNYLSRVDTYEMVRVEGQADQLVLQKRVVLGANADGNLTSRSVDLDATGPGTETVTETWGRDQDRISFRQVLSSETPGDVFRTNLSYWRAGLTPGDPSYDTSLPPENLYQVERVGSGGSETTTFTYDDNGQLLTTVPPAVAPADGLEIHRTYYPQGSTSPGGFPTGGLLQKIELKLNGTPDPHLTRTFSYDDQGLVASVTNARSKATSFSWDDRGRLKSITNAKNEQTRFWYTGPNEGLADPLTAPAGHFLTRVEAGKKDPDAGQIRVFRHDARGFLVEIEREKGGVLESFEAYVNDSDGHRTTATDATGRKTEFRFDDLKRLASVEDHEGNTTTFSYDATGNRRSVVDALLRETEFRYDALDRVTEVEAKGESPSLVTGFSYDAVGNVTWVTDPKPQRTKYTYDRLSRLEAVTQELGIDTPDPDDYTVRYQYDGRGRLERIVNARGNALDYAYEPWGGLASVEHYLTAGAATPQRTVEYAYDHEGNLRSTSDTEIPTGLAEDLSQDLLGDRLYEFTYDDLDRLEDSIAHYIPGGARTLTNSYDRFGNRSGLAFAGDSDGPLQHTWRFDELDRMTEAVLPGGADPTVSFDYRANDELEKVFYGSPTTHRAVTTYAYHPHGPIDSITTEAGIPLAQVLRLTYTPNAVLDLTGKSEQQTTSDPVESYVYGYDGVSRLTLADYPAAFGLPADERFVYDAAGNRDDADGTGTPLGTYGYDANNRIETSPGKGYVFDTDGNTIEINDGSPAPTTLKSSTFDFTNRLRAYAHAGGGIATYDYDPFGRRVRKVWDPDGAGPDPTETTWFLWDGDSLLAEYEGGTRAVRYAYTSGFSPIQTAQGAPGSEAVYDVASDRLDTPRILLDAGGTAVWRAARQAYGGSVPDEDPDGTPPIVTFNVRLPGQYFDADTSLHYNRHRWFDPSIGRYVNADPIGQFGILARRSVAHSRAAGSPQLDFARRSVRPLGVTLALIDDPRLGLMPGHGASNTYQYALGSPEVAVDPSGEISALGLGGGMMVTLGVGSLMAPEPVVSKAVGAACIAIGGAMILLDWATSLDDAMEEAQEAGEAVNDARRSGPAGRQMEEVMKEP